MTETESIFWAVVEAAEMEYVMAKSHGIADPVVELTADVDDPDLISISTWDRLDLINRLDTIGAHEAANDFRIRPLPDKPFVVMVLHRRDGATIGIIDREDPDVPDPE